MKHLKILGTGAAILFTLVSLTVFFVNFPAVFWASFLVGVTYVIGWAAHNR